MSELQARNTCVQNLDRSSQGIVILDFISFFGCCPLDTAERGKWGFLSPRFSDHRCLVICKDPAIVELARVL